jgi:hypothetical protein
MRLQAGPDGPGGLDAGSLLVLDPAGGAGATPRRRKDGRADYRPLVHDIRRAVSQSNN